MAEPPAPTTVREARPRSWAARNAAVEAPPLARRRPAEAETATPPTALEVASGSVPERSN
eukprot:449283-Alexandrium_andersonii.AAC.1